MRKPAWKQKTGRTTGVFKTDYSAAHLEDDTEVSFTTAESRLLRHLAAHPGQTLSRDQILDALSEAGSDRRDRTVDFLINRIRRKLRDDPKSPRFIATRYGGGYVWVAAQPAPRVIYADDVFVVIGPLRGLPAAGADAETARALAHTLEAALRAELEDGQKVVFDADYVAALDRSEADRLQVELTFFRDQEGLECVITCRSGTPRRVFLAERMQSLVASPVHLSGSAQVRELAPKIVHEHWRMAVENKTYDTPLPIAMQEATGADLDSVKALRRMGPKLRNMRERYPDEPRIKLKFATYLHSQYIVNGYDPAMCTPERRRADLEAIERLVLESLDFAQSEAHMTLMAAKLLYFVDRGYKSLALELARNGHRSNTAVSGSLVVVGQLHAFVGDTDTAMDYLRQADALSERNSNFDKYTLIIICQALIAGGRRDLLDPYLARIYGQHPLLRIFLEPVMTDPDHPSMRAKGAMLVMPKARTRAFLSNSWFIWARLCETPEHQANALRAMVNLAVRRHGRSVLPDEIVDNVPGLFV